MTLTQKALWYVETHLDSALSLEEIADAAGVSRFHLSRAFAVSTGHSLAAYVRARRLSLAARTLVCGAADILDVALAAGYGSHEAFTRAFRQHFGLTPEQLRSQAALNGIILQEPLKMDPSATLTLAPPRVVSRDAFLLFGLSRKCEACGDPQIPSQWNAFLPHFGHIDGQVGNVAYGAIYNSDDAGNYDYLCAVEVREFPPNPAEFTRLRVAAQRYAIFDHPGHISGIAATWKAIWEHGLADAGERSADGPSFERYGEQFDGRTGLGGVEIWIPIIPR